MLKSIQSHTQVIVVFKNMTERNVDLFWVDFNGLFVRYQNELQSGSRYCVHSYETHPWVAKDSKTGSPLLIKSDFVYFPELDEEANVQRVNITLPVYRLIDRCMDVLRSHDLDSTADSLEIPTILKHELKQSPMPTYKEYQSSLNSRLL